MQAEKNRKIIFTVILVILALNLYVLVQYFSKTDKKLHFYACNVGQGDSFYLRIANDIDILIDGGPDKSVLNCLGRTMPFWDRKIEVLMLTHPNADHYEGLKSVLDRYKVEKIVLTGYTDESKNFNQFLEKVRLEGSERVIVKKGSRLNLGEGGVFEVLSPEEGKSYRDLNNTSITGIFTFGETEILMTGDSLLQDVVGLRDVDILKVPHHGSRFNMNSEVLAIIKPEVSIISVGKNSYGHPTKEVLGMLEEIKSQVLRTDKNGTIEVVSDGKSYEIIRIK